MDVGATEMDAGAMEQGEDLPTLLRAEGASFAPATGGTAPTDVAAEEASSLLGLLSSAVDTHTCGQDSLVKETSRPTASGKDEGHVASLGPVVHTPGESCLQVAQPPAASSGLQSSTVLESSLDAGPAALSAAADAENPGKVHEPPVWSQQLKEDIMQHIEDLGRDGCYADNMDIFVNSVECGAYLQIYSWEQGRLVEALFVATCIQGHAERNTQGCRIS